MAPRASEHHVYKFGVASVFEVVIVVVVVGVAVVVQVVIVVVVVVSVGGRGEEDMYSFEGSMSFVVLCVPEERLVQ